MPQRLCFAVSVRTYLGQVYLSGYASHRSVVPVPRERVPAGVLRGQPFGAGWYAAVIFESMQAVVAGGDHLRRLQGDFSARLGRGGKENRY